MQIANVEMEQNWNGPEGEQWSRHADHYERSTRLHWARFLELVPSAADAHILDVGCGNGRSACELAERANQGDVFAVDLSEPMLSRARERARAAGLANVRFERGDAQVFSFPAASRDLVVSTFGVMFFGDPVAAFNNIRTALVADGRLAVLVWQGLSRNPWVTLVRDALSAGRELPPPTEDGPGPLGFADPGRVRRVLTSAGFDDVDLTSIEVPMDYGSDVDEAFAFASNTGAARALLRDLDEADTAKALDELRRRLEEHRTPAGIMVDSAAWLVTATNTG